MDSSPVADPVSNKFIFFKSVADIKLIEVVHRLPSLLQKRVDGVYLGLLFAMCTQRYQRFGTALCITSLSFRVGTDIEDLNQPF